MSGSREGVVDKKVSLPLIDICAQFQRKTQFTPGMSRKSSRNCYFWGKKDIWGRRNYLLKATKIFLAEGISGVRMQVWKRLADARNWKDYQLNMSYIWEQRKMKLKSMVGNWTYGTPYANILWLLLQVTKLICVERM